MKREKSLSAVHLMDQMLLNGGRLFSFLSSLCLLAMLILTAATILLRPFNMIAYWMFPWTMVLFVWLSFFGLFSAMIFARDVRIDFVAKRLGRYGMLGTRILGQVAVLGVVVFLLRELPTVLATQTGKIDGALLPGGSELARVLLSVPLALSFTMIALTVLTDILKMILGLPEYTGETEDHACSPAGQTEENL